MTFKRIALIGNALLLTGCAAQRVDVPTTHPANPTAPEASVPAESTTLKVQSANQALPHHQQEKAVAPYQCTMHPDVHSDKPGRCPKCGMQLKKRDGE